LGVRVPAIVISAHTPKGVIDHTVYDHTSILATVERMYGMGNLTNRDKAANDLQNLLSLETARTDAPTTLNSPATPNFPLSCDGDRKMSEDYLALSVEELRIAKRTGRYKDRAAKDYPIPKNQFGFLAIALSRVLETAEYPDRQAWIDEFKNIKDGVDASLFMVEARLKVKYGVDVKKNAREAAIALRNRNRVLRHLNLP
ncbi:MAG: alkaline phosphatase family protein, partial [Candidatus Acidiferrales bacterium]